jgi:hypothetical protein
MTDNRFQELLNNLSKSHNEYSVLLKKAEKEYERRFGNHPCDVNDDFWIDSFRNSPSSAKVEDVIESAKMYNA